MSDIWFCCKKTDKVVELSDCLECKEPKNCLSLASYKQGRADENAKIIGFLKYHRYAIVDNNGDYYSIEELEEMLKENSNE